MAGHIRKKELKNGHVWQVIVETGLNESGNRKRIYRTVKGTKQDAQKLLATLLTEFDNGTYIEPSKITFGAYLQDWLITYVEPNLSPTTQDSYLLNIEKHIIPHLGKILLHELKPLHLQRFYKTMLDSGRADGKGGLSTRSVRHYHRNIYQALEHAVRMQMISRNVAALVTLPKIKNPYRAKVYNEEELLQLIDVSKGSDMELPIALAAGLGLRRGELLGLLWSNINFEEKTLTVINNLVQTSKGKFSKDPKSESSNRTIVLPDGLISILKQHKKRQAANKLKLGSAYDNSGCVCCKDDGSSFCPGYFSRKFSKFLKDNELSHIRLHDLRHSNATLMLKYGIQPKVASNRLGHSSIAITLDLYSHVLSGMQDEVADKINIGLFKGANDL